MAVTGVRCFIMAGAVGGPSEPAFADTYVFPDEFGFDGQYYRIVAHDPFLTRGYLRYIERPVMRYRRILVPFLAFALAGGRQPYIDAGFIATILLFLFLGVYWLGGYAVLFGRSAKWGWAFLLAPGTLAGLERGAIDTALTALTIGFALYLREQSRYRLVLALVMAGLCRETGLCLILACAGAALLKRNWTMLALSCASMLPSLAWYGYIQMRSPADPSSNLLRLPLTDLLQNLLHHDSSYVNYGASFVQFTYYVAVFGMLLAFLLSVRLSFNGWTSAEGLAALAFPVAGLPLPPRRSLGSAIPLWQGTCPAPGAPRSGVFPNSRLAESIAHLHGHPSHSRRIRRQCASRGKTFADVTHAAEWAAAGLWARPPVPVWDAQPDSRGTSWLTC